MRVYLDHNATTPLRPEAKEAMLQAADLVGNPSSVHMEGQQAEAWLETCRDRVASLLGAEPLDVVFTSGGTESDNMAIKAALPAAFPTKVHLVTSHVEHPAVLKPCRALEEQGGALTLLECDENGNIDVETLKQSIGPETALVSIQHANSETGVVQDIKALARAAHKAGTAFHTDAVQTVGRLPVGFDDLDVDMLSFSGHKIGGPRGTGVLLTRHRAEITPLISGGDQERGRRAGTENLCGIAGMTAALEAAVRERESQWLKWTVWRGQLLEGLKEVFPELLVNGGGPHTLANTLNVSFPGVNGDDLMMALDVSGIAVSTGTACSVRALGPSSTLQAMKLEKDRLCSAIRISMGWTTTEADIEALLDGLPGTIRAASQKV